MAELRLKLICGGKAIWVDFWDRKDRSLSNHLEVSGKEVEGERKQLDADPVIDELVGKSKLDWAIGLSEQLEIVT